MEPGVPAVSESYHLLSNRSLTGSSQAGREHSTTLVLRVFHSSTISQIKVLSQPDPCIGVVEININHLLQMSNATPGLLCSDRCLPNQLTTSSRGYLKLGGFPRPRTAWAHYCSF